jgi:hypothetical protein
MSADDMMSRLMAMAGDDAAVAEKPEPKAKAKAEQAVARAARCRAVWHCDPRRCAG